MNDIQKAIHSIQKEILHLDKKIIEIEHEIINYEKRVVAMTDQDFFHWCEQALDHEILYQTRNNGEVRENRMPYVIKYIRRDMQVVVEKLEMLKIIITWLEEYDGSILTESFEPAYLLYQMKQKEILGGKHE